MLRPRRLSRAVVGHFALHARLGYVSGLLLFLVPFVVLASIDLYRYLRRGLDATNALGAVFIDIDLPRFQEWISGMFLFLVILPGLLALARVLPWSDRPFPKALSLRAKWIPYAYVAGAVGVVSFVWLAHFMEVTSGAEEQAGELRYSFESWLRAAVALGFIPMGLKAVSILGVLILPAVLEALFKGAEETESPQRNWFQKYLVRAKLADLGSDYYPHHGRHVLNFNAGSIAPAIRVIQRRAMQLVNGYQDAVPGSKASRDYLRSLWREAHPKLGSILGAPQVLDVARMALFESTTRALEAIVTGFPGNRHVLISPLEHPSELVMVRGLENKGFVSTDVLPLSAELFDLSSEDVEDAVALEIVKRLRPDAANIILLSEVCWATGTIIDVRRILEAVRSAWFEIKGSGTLKTVVDGAHAVGNLTHPQLDAADAYVFSGHKWILSPSPCGLAVIFDSECDFKTYDSWTEDLPDSTCDAWTICGLSAALELGSDLRQAVLIPRARNLKNTFLQLIQSEFRVVGGPGGGSLMVAIRPRERLRWRETWPAVVDALEASELSTLRIELDREDRGREHWLRLTFPYFLDHRDLARASEVLRGFVQKRVG